MLTTKLARPTVLAALLAVSLGLMPAAHAEGFKDKVKGVFTATGNAIKDSARATGDVFVNSAKATGGVLKESAKLTGDVLVGTAKAGEAACVATGDVLKDTAKIGGAACTATGDAVVGSARAVSTTTGTMLGATEGALGMHRKGLAPSAVTAANNTAGVKPAASSAAAPAKNDNIKEEISSVRNVPFTPEAAEEIRATTPLSPAPVVSSAAAKPAADPSAKNVVKTTALAKKPSKAPAKVATKVPSITSATSKSVAATMQPDPLSQPAASFAATAAPSTISTEGTRITPPVMENLTENQSPSWNEQQPVASSTAFASQYALRTTPLQANTP